MWISGNSIPAEGTRAHILLEPVSAEHYGYTQTIAEWACGEWHMLEGHVGGADVVVRYWPISTPGVAARDMALGLLGIAGDALGTARRLLEVIP